MMFLLINWGGALNLIFFSFSMVFILLVLIVFALNIFGKIFVAQENTSKKRKEKALISSSGPIAEVGESMVDVESISEEVLAAIAMALYALNGSPHDSESEIVTIERVSKRYTPWSSKIYGLNVWSRR